MNETRNDQENANQTEEPGDESNPVDNDPAQINTNQVDENPIYEESTDEGLSTRVMELCPA